jgi:uncharacterized damage-inducible protein DinB
MSAKETTEQYVHRILGNINGEPLDIQESTPAKLQQLIGNTPKEQLTKRASPDAWSVGEVLAHLADAEVVTAFRLRKIVCEPGTDIQAYDQNAWASGLRYGSKDPVESLKEFKALREMNLRLLRSLSAEELQRYGNHSERGKETVEHVCRLIAGHDVNHLKQIEKMLNA